MKQGRNERVARVRFGSNEFRKKGVSRFDLRDPYHLAVALTWPQFLAFLLAIYFLVNLIFAVFFWLIPGSVAHAHPNRFGDDLFFSIETLATVGYGEMYPATLLGRVIVVVEIICGIGFTAIVTGLTFVRFSRPRAKFIFASNPVVTMHNRKPTLMLRVANGRLPMLLDAVAKINVLFVCTSQEGEHFRQVQELRLERTHLPAFPLTWTLMHVLDEQSPLRGYDADRMIAARAQLIVTLEARDPALGALVHDIRNYTPEDIRFGMHYADAVTVAEDGALVADLTKVGVLESGERDRSERSGQK